MWASVSAEGGPTSSRGDAAHGYHGEGSHIVHDVSIFHPRKMRELPLLNCACIYINLFSQSLIYSVI